MLTRALALELGPHGIRVNAVSPGYIEVPEGGAALDPAYREAARAGNPLGRSGAPAEIAEAVLFLAGPGAAHISGAILSVDGGSSAGRTGIYPGGYRS
jgi:NAD(P)-dependent dehydrogenase (short-subunit alcohol dehydrogenase family)